MAAVVPASGLFSCCVTGCGGRIGCGGEAFGVSASDSDEEDEEEALESIFICAEPNKGLGGGLSRFGGGLSLL